MEIMGSKGFFKRSHGRSLYFSVQVSAVSFILLLVFFGFAEAKIDFEGSVSQKLRVRSTGAMDDVDMETLLTTSFKPQSSERWSGFVQMGEIYDLDADSPDSPFGSLYDT